MIAYKYYKIALFPGSPHVRTKNGKEREESGKIYHVRNVIGRKNLITFGRTNELAHALLTEYTCSFFGKPGTAYLRYSLVVLPNVYAVFPPCLSVRVHLSSDNC